MHQEYKDILKEIPKLKSEVDILLKHIFNLETGVFKSEYVIDITDDFARLEIVNDSLFTTTHYMDINLLYYCIYALISLMEDSKEHFAEVLISKEEYMKYPSKMFSDGVNNMCDIILES